jgi:hypothetical protein
MKKLISLLFIIILSAGCEIGVHPRLPMVATVDMCIGDSYEPYPNSWAYHCDSACCYYEFYDNGWTCEETWCYDYDYCSWEFVDEFCY